MDDPNSQSDLLDPQVMRDAIFATLHVLTAGEELDVDRSAYVDLLNKLHAQGKHHNNSEVAKQAHIAGVVSALFQGPSMGTHPLGPGVLEARSRLQKAIDLEGTSVQLPAVVQMVAQGMLARLPKAESRYSAIVLSGITNPKLLDGDFQKYRRLLEPIELRPAPRLNLLEETLTAEFPWMSKITADVVGQLRLAHECGRRHFHLRPILLVGDPGVGKTRYWRRIGAQNRVPFRILSAAGASDSMSLRGTSRGWSSSRPSTVVQMFLTELCANPIALVDEIDKAGTSRRNGNFCDVLLQMLEPQTASAWFDEGLDMGTCDLSHVSWVATANQLGSIPRALLDRFSIHLVRPPGKEHYPMIIHSVLRDIALEFGLPDERLLPHLGHGEREELVRGCDNVRQLARAIRAILQRRATDQHQLRMVN